MKKKQDKKIEVSGGELRDLFTIMNHSELSVIREMLVKKGFITKEELEKAIKQKGPEIEGLAEKFGLDQKKERPYYFG